MIRSKVWRAVVVLAVAAPLLVLLHMFLLARSEPMVRHANVALPDWPSGAAPVRIAFLSDIHVAGPDMPPSRLAKIVRDINTLHPDIVMIAGDFVSDKDFATHHYSAAEAIAPLGKLNAPLGTVAVLGNHDYWRDASAIRDALERQGIIVLDNDAVQRGPLAIGGIDDDFSAHADPLRTLTALDRLSGVKILLSHSPDVFPDIPDKIGLTLAGHTHCGQIALPVLGPLATASRHGKRYACGRISEGWKTLIVTAGLGTSILPLRLGVEPDLWVITVGPPTARNR